jgi:hypothetical protein
VRRPKPISDAERRAERRNIIVARTMSQAAHDVSRNRPATRRSKPHPLRQPVSDAVGSRGTGRLCRNRHRGAKRPGGGNGQAASRHDPSTAATASSAAAHAVKLHKGIGRAACAKNLGVTELGDDRAALAWVISKNLKRRHLNESQRAMVAASDRDLRLGDNQHIPRVRKFAHPRFLLARSRPAAEPPAPDVAERGGRQLNVSRRSVQTAAGCWRRAPEELQAVEAGAIAVSVAPRSPNGPPPSRPRSWPMLPRDDKGKLTPEAKKEIRKSPRRSAPKTRRRRSRSATDKEAELGTTIAARGKFGVVLEDFEWDHEPYSRETGMDRHPSNHYPTRPTRTRRKRSSRAPPSASPAPTKSACSTCGPRSRIARSRWRSSSCAASTTSRSAAGTRCAPATAAAPATGSPASMSCC